LSVIPKNIMKLKFKGLGSVFKNTFKGWNDDDPFAQSAVIAYYAIFSLPALLILVINIAGFFFGKEAVTNEVSQQIEDAMGVDTAESVNSMILKASETKAGIISSIIAIVTLILGATGVFVQLQANLNQIWDVKQKPNAGFVAALKNRLFSFGLVVSIGFLLLVSLVVSSLLAALSHKLESIFPEAIAYLFYALEFIISLTVITLMFALMFKILPDVKIKWKDVAFGSFLTGVLFLLGKYGLSFYFGKAEPASVYGAAGSVVLILLWTSYSSMIVFFGAEFTKQYAVYHGTEIVPGRNAEKIKTGGAKIGGHVTEGSEKKSKAAEQEITIDHSKSHVMKNKKEIQKEIYSLEKRLQEDKEHIKDNLTFKHILAGMLPFLFTKKVKHSIDDHLKTIARKNIQLVKPKGWFQRMKEALHLTRRTA
jgi:membrane protein